MLTIAPLGPADRTTWEKLSRGYNDFYETVHPPEVYDRTWALVRTANAVHGWSGSRTTSSTPTSGATTSATCRTCSSTRPPAGWALPVP